MPNELTTIPAAKLEAMELIAKECNFIAIMNTDGLFAGQIAMASAVHQLAELIDDQMMAPIMSLQNTGLGFKTDKAQGGYPVQIVKQVMIEATMRGLRMVGNEVNIIGGNFYATKNGMKRLVMEWPGLTDFVLVQDIPKESGSGASIGCKATWKLDGSEDFLECRNEQSIPVRKNAGQIIDAILGKGARKMYARVYDKLCGGKCQIPEGEAIDVPFEKARKVTKSTLLENTPADDDALEADYMEAVAAATSVSKCSDLVSDADRDGLRR